MKANDLKGSTFGKLIAIEQIESDSRGRARWRLKCACGAWHEARADNLLSGGTTACPACKSTGRPKHSPNVQRETRFTVTVIKSPQAYSFADRSTGKKIIHYHDYCTAVVRDLSGKILFRVEPKARARTKLTGREAALRLMRDHMLIEPQGERSYGVWARQEGVECSMVIGTPDSAYIQWGAVMESYKETELQRRALAEED